ncbi:hypothetical protein M422DRAFT_169455 [Sphaerobolus stellatus SS14]|uniref:CxC2-like cysteine cluster KDZ transposase-associated domain-containing protein n=1 Tax=Sphaerobolus stellatus (strain SS14) TaxID=990650 RepID=A0A0C9VNN5_SPHS4|nr:hypothetical protein M422DRAFT_169455 [Sphaerobolus stellatus SS14]
MYEQECPWEEDNSCLGCECTNRGTMNCMDCDLEGLFCQSCFIHVYKWLPFHRPLEWHDGQFQRRSLADLGYQLFRRRMFPASMSRPRTAFTFRLLKLFHMLNHVARTTQWDFVGTLHRLTDNVNPKGTPNIYKTFKEVQRQWRVVRAWKCAGVMEPSLPREEGSLVLGCVSCPLPGINLDEDWEKHKHTYVTIILNDRLC